MIPTVLPPHRKLFTWPWEKSTAAPDDEVVEGICSTCWTPIIKPYDICFAYCNKCTTVNRMKKVIRDADIEEEMQKRQTQRDKDFLVAQAYFKGTL